MVKWLGMDECIFCKIVKGEISSEKVYEDDKVLAFMDINPINPGHLLLIPKEHSRTILEARPEILQELIVHVPRLAKAAMDAVGADSFNLGVNTGKPAGQVVYHTHFHIIPRFATDAHRLWGGQPYQENKMQEIAGGIRDIFSKL